jgi:hypothetical protein
MKVCEAVEEKKRKRTVSGPFGGSSSGAPPEVPHDLHPTRGTAALPSATVLGQSPTAATAAVQPCLASTTVAAGGSQATTAVYTCRLPVL